MFCTSASLKGKVKVSVYVIMKTAFRMLNSSLKNQFLFCVCASTKGEVEKFQCFVKQLSRLHIRMLNGSWENQVSPRKS